MLSSYEIRFGTGMLMNSRVVISWLCFQSSPTSGRRLRLDAVMGSLCLCGVLTLLVCFGRGEASAQDTAAEEASRRAMVIAYLPPDAAKVLFGRESTPAAGPPRAIGSYQRGCLSGAIAMPADGPNWQVMHPSANRAWGHHPVLIAFLKRLAQKPAVEAGWRGLLVSDIARYVSDPGHSAGEGRPNRGS